MGRLTRCSSVLKGHGTSTSETAGKESDATASLYLTNDGDGRRSWMRGGTSKGRLDCPQSRDVDLSRLRT